MGSQVDSEKLQAKPFVEHLEDLRRTIIWSGLALCAGFAIAIPLAPYVLMLAKTRVAAAGEDPETFLRVLRVAGGLTVAVRIVLWTGIMISLPVVLLVIANFVFPGLKRNERRVVVHSAALAAALFTAGVCMGYFATLPAALRVMLAINAWLGVNCEFVELADYVSFALKLLLAFGLTFELPVLILALGRLGIVTSGQLRARRRHVIVGLMVLSMFLTPQDPFTLVMMAAPLIVLYELCIWAVYAFERRAARASQR